MNTMEQTTEIKTTVDIIVDKNKFTSIQNIINDLNNAFGDKGTVNHFNGFHSQYLTNGKFVVVTAEFEMGVHDLSIRWLYSFKEKLPDYIKDVCF